ncbi:hypothetical protein BA059_12800 [Mycolicibacterium sp. (ex Dasyatis americana)]|nr:hypothetical protein BA059_12800 [Mycolicibacterium sp. (ex Dasyatis americana)]
MVAECPAARVDRQVCETKHRFCPGATMSELVQIIVLMAVPAAVLLGLRRVVIRQNRRLDAAGARATSP